MDRSPHEIADAVRSRFRTQIIKQNQIVESLLKSGEEGDTSDFPLITGVAVEDLGIDVQTHFSFKKCSDLGNFGHPRPYIASVWVNGVHIDSKTNINVPTREAEGWARARLGKNMADYGYHVQTMREQIQRWPQLYVAILASSGKPILASRNFVWDKAGVGGPARPRKLAPGPENGTLLAELKKHGDMAFPEDERE